jgi:hypothetical protein
LPTPGLNDAESPQDGGQRLGLRDAKLTRHTRPATSPERCVSTCVSVDAVLRLGTIRVEEFRVRKILRVPVSCVRYDHGVAAGWQDVAAPKVSFILDFAEPEDKLPHSQEPAIVPTRNQMNPVHTFRHFSSRTI